MAVHNSHVALEQHHARPEIHRDGQNGQKYCTGRQDKRIEEPQKKGQIKDREAHFLQAVIDEAAFAAAPKAALFPLQQRLCDHRRKNNHTGGNRWDEQQQPQQQGLRGSADAEQGLLEKCRDSLHAEQLRRERVDPEL